MDRQQQELRRAAARAFAESLNKLEQTLIAEPAAPEDLSIEQPGEPLDLEQAVADIERFMQEKDEQN